MGLNYTDTGFGKTIVLVHGFCESIDLWKTVEPQLSQFCRVICVDLPGFGESKYEDDEITITWFADKVIKLLDELRINTFSLVGHSLGGYVSLAIAEKTPRRIESMVMLHSTAYADTEEKKENRDKMIGFIQRNGLSIFMNSFVSPLFSEINRLDCKKQIDELIVDGKRAYEEAVIATILAMKNRPDRTDLLETLDKPILWIVGEDDVAVPLEDSLKLIEIGSKTQSIVIKNCGHMGMIEKPTTTIMKLIEFFS